MNTYPRLSNSLLGNSLLGNNLLGNNLLGNNLLGNTLLGNSHLENNLLAQTIAQAELSESRTLPPAEGEAIRHILLGTPGGIRQTIHLLHTLRYVESALWSPLVSLPSEPFVITPRQGEVMSILVRPLR